MTHRPAYIMSIRPRLLLTSLACLLTFAAHAQVITTFAGTDFVFAPENSQALRAPLGQVNSVTIDATGNLYVTDEGNNMVLRIRASGLITVLAGNGLRGFSGDGGAAANASLNIPWGVAVDVAGNVYFADSNNHRIREVTADGRILTVAGTGAVGFSGDGGPANRAQLHSPKGVAVDRFGNLYIADALNYRIRKVSSNGIITSLTAPGTAPDVCSTEMRNLTIKPSGLTIDNSGSLYIGAGHLCKVLPDGTLTTVVVGAFLASGPFGASGVALDRTGNVFVADQMYSVVHKVAPDGTVSTVAGTGLQFNFDNLGANQGVGFSGDGGPATKALLNAPSGIALDAAGSIYVADSLNDRIRKITADGKIATVAGNGAFHFSGDGGAAENASFNSPQAIFLDSGGGLYVADKLNNRIRLVRANGIVSTVAGNGTCGVVQNGIPSLLAGICSPSGVGVDGDRNLYVGVQGHTLRINAPNAAKPEGSVDVLPNPNTSTPPAPYCHQITFFGSDLYCADGSSIWLADSASGKTKAYASYSGAAGVAVDGAGNIYFSLSGQNQVVKSRMVSVNGATSLAPMTTVAGNGKSGFSGDGDSATSAALKSPGSLALDKTGNLYIADTGNFRVRKVTPGGVISTIAGNGASGFFGDGGPPARAALGRPSGLAVSNSGTLYVADADHHRIRAILPAAPTAQVSPAELSFQAVSNGAATSPKRLTVTAGIAGMSYTATAAVLGGGAWLTLRPASGFTPANISITADPSTLEPGMHSATIFITLPDANPKSLIVRISFRVLDPIPPKLVVDSPRLTFTTPGPAILRSVLNVANGGGGTLSFSASSSTESGASWLAITPANSQATPSTPAQLLVSVDSASLTPGVYRGAVSVSAGTGEQSSTPVTLVVGGSRQQLLLSQRGMTFQASRDGGAPLPQSLSVLNRGQGALDWTARARSENSWLTISPAAGSVARPMLDSSAINVSADPTGLPAGVYYGRIEVFAGEGPAQSTTVVLNVTEADFAPAPQIQPAGLIFTGRTGDTPGSQNVTARNRAAAPLFYNSTGVTLDGADWLQYIPKNANIGTAQPQRVVVQPAFASIGPGVYDGAITFLFGESIHIVRVKTIVASQSCTPSRLILLPTSHEESFVAMQYLPVSLEVQVVDDCGNPLTADRAGASVTAGFSNGDQTINLIPTRGGFWSNTWQPVASANGPAFLTLRATLQQPNGLVLSTAAQLQANIAGESNVPVIRRQLNAASQMTDAPLAPGSLFTITGSALAGAAVRLGAEPVPTLLTSAAQINGQTPWDAPLNTEAELIVQRGNAISLPQPVVVAAASPAIFTQDGSGAGAGLIADAVTGLINGAANPAHAGDTIVIHATGLGSPDQQVTLNVADLPAEVVSVQQSSVVPGAFEITALVPETIEPGDALPVRITVAGQGSPAVTMVVR